MNWLNKLNKKINKYIDDAPKRKQQRIQELKQEIAIEKLNTQLHKTKQARKKYTDKQEWM